MYDDVLIFFSLSLKLVFFFVTRETLLQYISEGDDVQAQGSLFVLATLLQTKGICSGVVGADSSVLPCSGFDVTTFSFDRT